MISKDFTLKKYEQLCNSIVNHYVPSTVCDYLSNKEQKDGIVVIRHDVDRYVKNALIMAILESQMGIHSTYYFRYPSTFNVDIMTTIANMGHEIGYHYECLAKTHGDFQEAMELFRKELGFFKEAGFSISSVCPHGGSLIYPSTKLLHNCNIGEYGLLGEADDITKEDKDIAYFSDTGRTWGKSSLKASVDEPIYGVRNTNELIDVINKNSYSNILLLAHPERWALNSMQWIRSQVLDLFYNSGKRLWGIYNKKGN